MSKKKTADPAIIANLQAHASDLDYACRMVLSGRKNNLQTALNSIGVPTNDILTSLAKALYGENCSATLSVNPGNHTALAASDHTDQPCPDDQDTWEMKMLACLSRNYNPFSQEIITKDSYDATKKRLMTILTHMPSPEMYRYIISYFGGTPDMQLYVKMEQEFDGIVTQKTCMDYLTEPEHIRYILFDETEIRSQFPTDIANILIQNGYVANNRIQHITVNEMTRMFPNSMDILRFTDHMNRRAVTKPPAEKHKYVLSCIRYDGNTYVTFTIIIRNTRSVPGFDPIEAIQLATKHYLEAEPNRKDTFTINDFVAEVPKSIQEDFDFVIESVIYTDRVINYDSPITSL